MPEQDEANWRKSKRSMNHGSCVEVAGGRAGIMMRDSTDREGPQVRYPASAWRAFTAALREQ
jgi:hypothetical protein